MKTLLVAGAFALLATPVLAVPYCDPPIPDQNGLVDYGFGPQTESDAAAQLERELNAEGVGAHQTRFWQGCVQTWVNINGHDVMKFYDPATLQEVH